MERVILGISKAKGTAAPRRAYCLQTRYMHMLYPDSIYTARMNDQQRAWFYAEYERARKDEIAGVLFAIFLGGWGIHHFYLGNTGLGILYVLFFWTGIPHILGWIECFFMPERVRAYNVAAATQIASGILAYPPPPYRQDTVTGVPA